MLIFLQAQLVLFAVPKTGTSALESALAPQADLVFRNPPRLKHMRMTWAQKALPPLLGPGGWKSMESVALVREPLDWLGSWYRYRQREGLIGRPTSTADLTFAEFLEAHLRDPQPDFAAVGSQVRFIQNRNGRVGVHHLFAYERFGEAVDFLQTVLNCSITLERRNVSPPGALDIPDALRERVRKELSHEFALHDAVMKGEKPKIALPPIRQPDANGSVGSPSQ